MAVTLRFLQVFSIGAWLGAIGYFSFVIAPGAFAVLGNRDLAGLLVNYALGRLHTIGIVCGAVYVLATALSGKSVSGLVRPAVLLVVLMILLTVASQYGVVPRMAELRLQMGSVDATSATNPLRVAFDRLHQYSVWLEGAVLLTGLAALFLTVRERAR